MIRYFIRRLLYGLLVLLGVVVTVFFVIGLKYFVDFEAPPAGVVP